MPATPPLSLHAWLRYDAMSRLLRCIEIRSVLEIGVGQGSFGVFLAREFEYLGLEIDHQSYETAVRRFETHGVDPDHLINGGVDILGARQFDLVCAFEVLEHFEDDLEILKGWRKHVRPGGWIMVSLPACATRFGRADERAGHFRRYDRSDAAHLLSRCGFSNVEIVNYGFPIGYALEALRNLIARRTPQQDASPEERTRASGRWLQPPEPMAPLMRASAVPFRHLQRPFSQLDLGTGLIALGQAA
jgi:SAM-dependent methyltransferase